MTQISLTSGEIMDLLTLLDNKINQTTEDNPSLSCYYGNIYQQFESVVEKLKELPGEKRVANLVLVMN
jgi:hypothetical protein